MCRGFTRCCVAEYGLTSYRDAMVNQEGTGNGVPNPDGDERGAVIGRGQFTQNTQPLSTAPTCPRVTGKSVTVPELSKRVLPFPVALPPVWPKSAGGSALDNRGKQLLMLCCTCTVHAG